MDLKIPPEFERAAATARRDLVKLATYTAEESGSDETGERVVRRLQRGFERIADSPSMGRTRGDVARGYRYHPVPPYLIFYRIVRDGVSISRIVHERRDLATVFKPLRKKR